AIRSPRSEALPRTSTTWLYSRLQGLNDGGVCLLDHARRGCVIAPDDGSTPRRMRYADGGGLTAAGRARRERVRLQAGHLYEQDVKPVQVAPWPSFWRLSCCSGSTPGHWSTTCSGLLASLVAAARPGWPPGQSRAQDAALPHPPHLRPSGTQRPAAALENLRGLALGSGDHDRLGPDRRPAGSPLTSSQSSLRPRKEQPQRGPWNPRL